LKTNFTGHDSRNVIFRSINANYINIIYYLIMNRGFGYDSPMDTDPTRRGTQLNPYDQNPNVPGVQNYGNQGNFGGGMGGMGGNRGFGYDSPMDTDPTRRGTQLNPYDQNPNVPGVQNYGNQGGFGGGNRGGMGGGRFGYDSPMDTDPTRRGTQLNPYDQNPNVPGVQNYGNQGGFGGGMGGNYGGRGF
jgi:hypothetical protein